MFHWTHEPKLGRLNEAHQGKRDAYGVEGDPGLSNTLSVEPSYHICSDSTSTSSPARSVTDQVMEKARHLHDYLDLINNKDASVRLAAMESALGDADPTVRGVALASYLKRFEALTPEIVLDAASPVAQEDVPIVITYQLRWSADGTSFTGSGGCSGYSCADKLPAANWQSVLTACASGPTFLRKMQTAILAMAGSLSLIAAN